ncbi:hypothetical protein EG329_006172 [Mollisiaceae sp. DMI_Dod_QoI]|nr:hypothetical protein EG329_006172 [Helotiales sp. DMI_Dod_QoI]
MKPQDPAFQNPQYPIGAPQTTTIINSKPPVSLWWATGCLVGWIGCFIAGAALIGAWANNSDCVLNSDIDFDTESCSSHDSQYWAGVAFIIVAVILKLVFWTLMIVRCYQRRRGYVAVTVNNTGHPEQGIPLNSYQQPQREVPGYATQQYADVPLQSQYDPVHRGNEMKYCGLCGTGNTGSHCSKCNATLPM